MVFEKVREILCDQLEIDLVAKTGSSMLKQSRVKSVYYGFCQGLKPRL